MRGSTGFAPLRLFCKVTTGMPEAFATRVLALDLLRGHSFVRTSIGAGGVVIDGGAHRCEFANEIASRFDVRVIALEPNPALATGDRHPQVTLVRGALADSDGSAFFKVDENPEASALCTPGSEAGAGAVMEVEKFSLASILDNHSIDTVELLKLDIEGTEYLVLETLDSAMAKRINQISVEFHPMNPIGSERERMFRVFERLNDLGFASYKMSYGSYGDVLFLNRSRFRDAGPFFAAIAPFYRKYLEKRQVGHS